MVLFGLYYFLFGLVCIIICLVWFVLLFVWFGLDYHMFGLVWLERSRGLVNIPDTPSMRPIITTTTTGTVIVTLRIY